MRFSLILATILPLIVSSQDIISQKAYAFFYIIVKFGIASSILAMIIGGTKLLLAFGRKEWVSEGKSWIIGGLSGLILILSGGFLTSKITGKLFTFSSPPSVYPAPYEKKVGVTFYWAPDCKKSTEKIGKIKSVRIENTPEEKWGVVSLGEDLKCQIIFKEGCTNLSFTPTAISYFEINPNPGGKVVFYPKTYKSGLFTPKAVFKPKEPKEFDLSKVSMYKKGRCTSLANGCLRSFYIQGDYFLILKNSFNQCRIFAPLIQPHSGNLEVTVGNLQTTYPFSKIEKSPTKAIIIPIKYAPKE